MKIFRNIFLVLAVMASAFAITGLSSASVHNVSFNEEIKSWFTSKVEASETPKEQPNTDNPSKGGETDNPGTEQPGEDNPVEDPVTYTDASYFNFDNGTLKGLSTQGLEVYNSGELTELIIPATYTVDDVEYSVTSIGSSAFSSKTLLTRVEIPNGVEMSSSMIFDRCSSLGYVKLPEDLTILGMSCFSNCTSLTSIDLPDTLTALRGQVFYGCTSLTSIDLPDNLTSFGTEDFARSGLKTIVLHKNFRSLWRFPFNNCTALTSIVCEGENPPTFASGFNLGSNLTALENIYVPADCVAIYESAEGWSTYADLIVDIRVMDFDATAFTDSSYFTFDNGTLTGLSDKGLEVYNNGELTEISIPTFYTGDVKKCVVKTIGIQAFYNKSLLTRVEIPNGVHFLNSSASDSSAFEGCSALEYVKLPEDIYYLPSRVFANCTSLININLQNIQRFGGNVFYGCTSLTSVTLSEDFDNLYKTPFTGCVALTSIICKGEVPPTMTTNLGSNLTALEKIYVPVGCAETYKTAEGWSTYADLIVEVEE